MFEVRDVRLNERVLVNNSLHPIDEVEVGRGNSRPTSHMSGAQKVSFDSNVWENLFDQADSQQSQAMRPAISVVRRAIRQQAIRPFICDATFRLDAIQKDRKRGYPTRKEYLARLRPHIGHAVPRSSKEIAFSIGPNNSLHPGLPAVQAVRLQRSLELGAKLMRSLPWLFLPTSCEPNWYISEVLEQRNAREEIQHQVFHALQMREVGHAKIERIRTTIDQRWGFEHQGWTALLRANVREAKLISDALAEWSDAELVASHIAYGHDLLCTEDRARGAKKSVFDADNRRWLQATYRTRFVGLSELASIIT